MRHWHEQLDTGYGMIEKFNHGYPARSSDPALRTLEIGAGRGGQIGFERLGEGNYYAVELRQEMADAILERFPKVTTVVADAQSTCPSKTASSTASSPSMSSSTCPTCRRPCASCTAS